MTGGIFRRLILPAVLSAGLLCIGLPATGGLWPLLFVALVPFLAALSTARPGGAAWCGLALGIAHFLLLLYWIVFVLGHYGGLPWYLAYPALFLLATVLALFVVVFAVAARLLFASASPAVVLWTLPCLWVGLDWVRSFLFSGFPWMDLGYGLWQVPRLIQVADITGHYGITFLLLLTNTLLALLVTGRGGSARLRLIAPVLVLFCAVAGYSAWRWQALEKWLPTAPTMRIGVVQGNVAQDKKWSPAEREKTVMDYVGQSDKLFDDKKPELIAWPETALPFFPEDHPLMEPIRDLTVRHDIALLTGAPWYTVIDPVREKFRFYNSALLIDAEGRFAGQYFKTHLVPFGEYVPLQKYLTFIAPLVQAVGDFTVGTVETPIVWRKARIGVLICYESIFPEITEKWVRAGANVLINLTNDAWYGKSSAPYQSYAMTVFRAVESRRSVVRAANTGISGFIDPLGRIRMQSPLFVPWHASDQVVLSNLAPFVDGYGHLFAPLCFYLGAGAVLLQALRKRLQKKSGPRLSTAGRGTALAPGRKE